MRAPCHVASSLRVRMVQRISVTHVRLYVTSYDLVLPHIGNRLTVELLCDL